MDKILAIVRTSTLQQELTSQKDEMEIFCRDLGYTNNQILWLEAKGASARSLNKEYLQLLENVKSKIIHDSDIKAVGVWHLNRLGRKEIKIVEMKQFFIQHHVNLHIKNPSITLFDRDGKLNQMSSMFINMLAVSIEIDTDEFMQKTKRGKEHNTKLGKFNGGAYGALYGYYVKEDKYCDVDPAEAEVVKQIYEMYASGKYSYLTLANELRARGIKHRKAAFSDNIVKKVLAEERYTGDIKYPKIIEPELYQKVKEVAENNTRVQAKNYKRVCLGIKILKCRHCGRNYTATSTDYVCYGRRKGRFDEPCRGSETIRIEVMDNILLHLAKVYHVDNLSTPNEENIKAENEKISVLIQKQREAEEQIEKTKKSLERLKDLYIQGDLNSQRYNEKKDGLNAQIEALRKQKGAYIHEQLHASMNLEAMKNPDVESILSLFTNFESEENKKELFNIVHTYIKEAYIERGEYDKKQCMYITVHPFKGKPTKFVYLFRYGVKEVYILGRNKLVPLA